MQSLAIPLAEIGELPADQYVGMIDEAAIACLSVRLAAQGLLTPIWLRRNGNAAARPWSVIAGRHRLRAATALGWTEIEAVQKAGPDAGPDQLRELQVAENLDRRILPPIERACHFMERWRRAWEIISQRSDADYRAADEATAAQCGVTDRTIRTYRKLHTEIVVGLPDLFDRLNAHPLGDSLSAMTTLAGLNPTARRVAAEMILSRRDWPNLQAALVAAGIYESTGNRSTASDYEARFVVSWTQMRLHQKRVVGLRVANDVPPTVATAMIDVFRSRGLLP